MLLLLCLRLKEWFTVLENYHRLTATISDLIMGNSYCFRVFAQNQVGISESSAVTKGVATIQKTGDLLDSLLNCSGSICGYNKEFSGRASAQVGTYSLMSCS